MTLVGVTSLPSLMILALILSEAKPLMIVSWSTPFHIAPSGYSASFNSLSSLVHESLPDSEIPGTVSLTQQLQWLEH